MEPLTCAVKKRIRRCPWRLATGQSRQTYAGKRSDKPRAHWLAGRETIVIVKNSAARAASEGPNAQCSVTLDRLENAITMTACVMARPQLLPTLKRLEAGAGALEARRRSDRIRQAPASGSAVSTHTTVEFQKIRSIGNRESTATTLCNSIFLGVPLD